MKNYVQSLYFLYQFYCNAESYATINFMLYKSSYDRNKILLESMSNFKLVS